MTILAIDTCANLCAAAVFGDDGELKSRACDDIGRGHAARLLGIVDEALAGDAAKLSDLTRVIVAVGPGSFTGIRVGVATARGYGVTLDVSVVGITTFALLNAQARANHANDIETCVAVAGGRGQAFVQRFSKQGLAVGEPRVMALDNAAPLDLPTDVFLIGNAALLLDPDHVHPHLLADRATGDIAHAFQAAEIETREPEPLYIRAADAKPQSDFALPRKSALT